MDQNKKMMEMEVHLHKEKKSNILLFSINIKCSPLIGLLFHRQISIFTFDYKEINLIIIMETLYSSWNPGEQYHLTTLSKGDSVGISSSSLSSSSPSSSSSSSSSPSSSSTTIAALMAATSYLVGCDTPPTPVTCDSGIFNNHNNSTNSNMFYSPTLDPSLSTTTTPMVNITMTHENNENMVVVNYDDYHQTISYNDVVPSDYYNCNNNNDSDLTNGQSSSFLSHHTNYSIPTSMESPANTSYSSPSPSPDLWENYGLTDNVKHLNQHCNLDQQLNLQQQTNHHDHNPHHHHHHQHQHDHNQQNHHSIATNYHNQHSAQHQQQIQHQNNLDDNKSNTYTINDNVITTANNNHNNNSTINTINNNHNKDISVKAKNTINPINKSTNYRASYKIKKSQIDTNLIKPKASTGNQRNHHHRSIESRGGGSFDKYLSPEDEDRRRRRRERNKVAATKCRNKKKVHVYKLCQESQTLESTNYNLKEEMENLKREEQRLNDILVKHLPFCVRRTLQPISDTINM
ncbi:GATA zinc finger domain-containing protein 14-like isoform X2 [Panonychus citri]|uniref:GATA zinc finger domain-containing protein 14-like isoform X2 n=1 Tax=Panonychus citri TaxID=50023 RepID=UPI0023074B8C|nr:GATA zinc finger domain-containing protein 14-like isoform X2 [Panonychus citri]